MMTAEVWMGTYSLKRENRKTATDVKTNLPHKERNAKDRRINTHTFIQIFQFYNLFWLIFCISKSHFKIHIYNKMSTVSTCTFNIGQKQVIKTFFYFIFILLQRLESIVTSWTNYPIWKINISKITYLRYAFCFDCFDIWVKDVAQ